MPRPKLDHPNFKLWQREGAFYVRWFEAGKKRRVSLGTTDRSEARRRLKQFEAGFGTPEPPAQPTIAAILDGYLADRKSIVRSYDTLVWATGSLRRHLGELEPAHLTRKRIRDYARDRRNEGHEVGPPGARRRKPTTDGSIIRELVTLRAAMVWAVREKWIAEKPYIETPRQPPPRQRWLTRDEADRLLSAPKQQHVRTFLALALHTAARAGAILALRWEAVDFELRLIDLGQAAGNKGRATVPINDALLPVLRDAHQLATCPYVIEAHGQPVKSVKTGTRAAARRAGLDGVTPHVLRHTGATWMAMDGISMPEIARFLGHTNSGMVEKVYAKFGPEYLRAAAAVLGRGAPECDPVGHKTPNDVTEGTSGKP